jgi:hypothetical protein
MTFKGKILVTIVVIVGFDAVASLASSILQFDYTSLVWVSLVIYLAAGYGVRIGEAFYSDYCLPR